MEARNVDDVLVRAMADKANGVVPTPEPIKEAEPVQESNGDNLSPVENIDENKQETPKEPEIKPEIAEKLQKEPEKSAASENNLIDEYGNPVEKPKMYSEDEVQRMIRDRLSRGRHAEQPQPTQHQPTQHQVQQAQSDGFTADPNSEQPWEQQLETFIEKTIEKRTARQTEHQWRQQEAQKQADFEVKFTSGMGKYQDFHQVIAGKTITDSMMLAARNLENPAAFVYGAAKLHPAELDRIARIGDPYAQAAEVGRLHERMVKDHRNVTKAAKPLDTPKGDLPAKTYNPPSIDQRIQSYGQSKRK